MTTSEPIGAADGRSDAADLAAEIAALQQLDAAALQRRWRALLGGPIPGELGRPLTLRMLAYQFQAQRLGDLDKASLRELSALAVSKAGEIACRETSLSGTPSSLVSKTGKKPSVAAVGQRNSTAAPRIARPGIVLVREHGGVRHQVMVLDEGVSWNGRSYDSLSQVAFAITGTKWNGPRFFGLREKQAQEGSADRQAGASIATARIVVGGGRVIRTGRSSSRVSP